MRRVFDWLDGKDGFTTFWVAVCVVGLILLIDWAMRSIPRGKQ